MNRFSNINWAAFLLGSLWGNRNNFKMWTNWWVAVGSGVILAFFFGSSSDFAFVYLCFYVFTVITAVYLGLYGNRMLLREIQKQELGLKEDLELRMEVSARQRKQLVYGVFFKPFFFYFLMGSIAFRGMPLLYFVMLAIDVLAFATILLLALRKNCKEGELYSDAKIDTESIAAVSMNWQVDSKKKR
ncbi:MAG: hypothetical protein FWD93_04125 [Coriobacteriia bacterium]|nr:hypothetical protein [Coriobacteriia bacterium]